MRQAKRIIRENLLSILIAVFISSIGGMFLKSFEEALFAIPALLVLIPALNDMAGDFGCIIASRFTTMFYAGAVQVHHYRFTGFRIIPKMLMDKLRERRDIGTNMLRTIDRTTRSYISILESGLDILAQTKFRGFAKTIFFVAFLSSLYLGLGTITICLLADIGIPSYSKLMLISFVCGVSLVFTVTVCALTVSVIALRHGWNLDNVIIPIVTAIGDLSGICFLLITAKLLGLI